MATKSSYISPYGTYNHISADFISPKTAATNILFSDANVGGTEFAGIDITNQAIMADKIVEYTSANGVVVDDVKIKDKGVYVDTITERTSSNGTSINSVYLRANKVGAAGHEVDEVYANILQVGDDSFSDNPRMKIYRVTTNDFRFICNSDTYDVIFRFQNAGTKDAVLYVDEIRIDNGAGGYWTLSGDSDTFDIETTVSSGNVHVDLEGTVAFTAAAV